MSVSKRRVRGIFRKELREYRHNGNIIVAMVIFPLIFLIQPLLTVLTEAASASSGLAHEHVLLYMLAIPVLVPAALASYSVVGERQQGTLEPVLATPIRREEFLLGKALAAFVPSVAISYAVLAFFIACVELFAHPGMAPALLRAPDLLALLLFTPFLAAWSIWVGIAISARSSANVSSPAPADRMRSPPRLTRHQVKARSERRWRLGSPHAPDDPRPAVLAGRGALRSLRAPD
jgi:ABC-type transport system involved in multi-copper enzyme maturation permease subunit